MLTRPEEDVRVVDFNTHALLYDKSTRNIELCSQRQALLWPLRNEGNILAVQPTNISRFHSLSYQFSCRGGHLRRLVSELYRSVNVVFLPHRIFYGQPQYSRLYGEMKIVMVVGLM